MCINGRRYVCCGECNVSDEPTPCLVKPIGVNGGEVMYLFFLGELGFLNYDDICMYVVNNSLSSTSLFLIPFMLTCRFLSLLLQGLCACVVSVVMWSSLVCL